MFELPSLSYDPAALEPIISARTMDFHYNKHHRAYVDNLNKVLVGSSLEGEDLESIILKTAGQPEQAAIFNNAGQHFNHSFFWQSLQPFSDKLEPEGEILDLLVSNFGSLDNFYTEFKSAAGSLFGSGWIWLVKDGSQLKIMKMQNADNPVAHEKKPVFGLDVWEHSYYLDYQNRRQDFVEAVIKNLVNWHFVAKQL